MDQRIGREYHSCRRSILRWSFGNERSIDCESSDFIFALSNAAWRVSSFLLTHRLKLTKLLIFFSFRNFYSINYVFSGLMESVGASRKVFEYMNREPAIKYEGQVETPIKGEVQFESVSFAYPTRASTEVLKVSLRGFVIKSHLFV